jgi:hypothetical protein
VKETLLLLLSLALALPSRSAAAQSFEGKPRPAPTEHARPRSTDGVAFADPRDPNPGSGRRRIIAGWIAAGVFAGGVAQLPLCQLNDYEGSFSGRRCVGWSIAFAAAGLSLAIPLLVSGYRRRAAQNAWRKRHGLLSKLQCTVRTDGVALSIRGEL